MFTERNWIHRLLPKKMMATFYTQRKDIIRGMATEKLKKEWPFLFEMSEIQAHFRELTGVQLDGTYSESLKSKGQGILAYKKTKSTKKVEQFVEILTHKEGLDDCFQRCQG
ncbi:hypothetical protein EOD39_19614 [Acipenser ruthenus]|uniref:Uncharacterized protein n=1 Tax=Acipenser ruthenus TaxID=7906 RepID=A0A444UXL3_ACIRT|nr:hypothetical protein EOD39_19614 [Acipenser ruthenus]